MKQSFRILEYAYLIIIISITSLALFSNRFGWSLYLEIFSHFQVQYFIITLLLALGTLILRHFRFLLAALFFSAILAAQILPWYIPSHTSILQANYRILVANLNFSNQDATQTLALIDTEQPDLALFIEVSQAMETQLEALNTTMPYSANEAAKSGLILYSKYPLTNVRLKQFGLNARKSLTADLKVNGQLLSLVAVHPLPPMGRKMFQSRNTLLADAGDHIKNQTIPVIFMGDLNTTMWSPYYQSFIRKTGLKNARKGFGIRPTWPAVASYYGLPNIVQAIIKPLQIPIDHCLVNSQVTVVDSRTSIETGSDHLPLITDLWIKSTAVTDGFSNFL
ncbi:MAG: endonuclease/exonuclease/phosphatase family protein [Leptolyngbya sp. SIO3F4]|nr:endonuclease/exonuclease/phosphatase family protein [Leptolyngbya sp. SIO3F4]